MFVGHEITIGAAYPDARAGLVGLTHGGWLSDASGDAYAEGLAGLVRVGPFGEMPGASKLVRVLLLEPVDRDRSLTLSLRWEATGPMGRLFPVLDANIILIPAGESASQLALAGAYRPPFAEPGQRLDRMVLHRAASATVRSLLRRIAETIAPDGAAVGDRFPRPASRPAYAQFVPSTPLMIQTRDGRWLEVLTSGADDGLPLLFHTGTPGGLAVFPPMAEAEAARGLRTVMYARPGYGDSTPRLGRLVADCAADAAAILDHLGVDQFVTVGWSGGGPHALACAALLPGRCLAAASLAGVAPRRAEGLDWLAGMGPENIEEFSAAAEGSEALGRMLAAKAAKLTDITGEQVAASMPGLLSPADQSVLTGDFAGYLAASFRAALRGGIAGWRDDDLAFVGDWGFAVADCSAVPTAVWQGDRDLMVPFGHGAWLATHVPGARVHLRPGEGHLIFAGGAYGLVLDDLLGLAGRSPAGAGRG
jgi:pimeloyl-ACP methyl ester carboxylesterase